jgi:GNAT superfamily N-acetyltransferase
MLVRKATTTDQEKILNLRIQLQRHGEQSNPLIWRITEAGRQKLVHDVGHLLTDDTAIVLVAEHENTLIGFAHGQILRRTEYKPNKAGIIGLIFVLENYRRQGIGTQLIHKLCKYFEAENVSHISLRYVLGNKEAEAFWQHLGFTPILYTSATNLETLRNRVKLRK